MWLGRWEENRQCSYAEHSPSVRHDGYLCYEIAEMCVGLIEAWDDLSMSSGVLRTVIKRVGKRVRKREVKHEGGKAGIFKAVGSFSVQGSC